MRIILVIPAAFIALTGASLASPASEMQQAIAACLYNGGDAQSTYETLSELGWEGDADDEAGVGYIYPATGENTVVTVALDGSWCNAESFVQSSEDSAMQLLGLIEGEGGNYDVSYDKDEMGCTQFGLGDGWKVTVLSGGQDPICGAADNSAIRFEFPIE
jgi:hypothetical protein